MLIFMQIWMAKSDGVHTLSALTIRIKKLVISAHRVRAASSRISFCYCSSNAVWKNIRLLPHRSKPTSGILINSVRWLWLKPWRSISPITMQSHNSFSFSHPPPPTPSSSFPHLSHSTETTWDCDFVTGSPDDDGDAQNFFCNFPILFKRSLL